MTGCDDFPGWQGCECELDADPDGDHECVCGARWDDEGHLIRPGYQDDPPPLPTQRTA